jgi:hypothetical protein
MFKQAGLRNEIKKSFSVNGNKDFSKSAIQILLIEIFAKCFVNFTIKTLFII